MGCVKIMDMGYVTVTGHGLYNSYRTWAMYQLLDMGYVKAIGHGLCNKYGYGLCNSYWTWVV